MNADKRETSVDNSVRPSASDVESGIEIPHNAVNIEGQILRNHKPVADFIDDASHDLHTPLNVIIGMCRLLDRYPEPLTSKQQDAVHRIERNAQSLLKSINELLRHLRSEQGN